eukprot:8363358-Heterocapsa_arctica.AAC.1
MPDAEPAGVHAEAQPAAALASAKSVYITSRLDKDMTSRPLTVQTCAKCRPCRTVQLRAEASVVTHPSEP